MAKANLLDLPVMKGTFDLEGKLFNVASEHAFSVNEAGTWRTVRLGVRVSDGDVAFFTVKGGQKNTAWMSKRGEKKGDKGQTKEVAWADRKKEACGGWQVMGVSMGLEKENSSFDLDLFQKDSSAKNEFYSSKNILTSLSEWDAFDYLKEHAVDGMDVFVQGEIEFSTYEKDGEVQHYRNLVAKKIYLKNKPIDFNAEGYKPVAQFKQTVIFNGTHSDAGVDFLDVGVIGWHSYNETSFQTTPKLIADMRNAKLKKGSSLTVIGNIKNDQVVEEVASVVWGEDTTVKRANGSGKISFLVTGADANSVTMDIYPVKTVEKYIEEVAREKAEKKNKSESFESQTGGLGENTTTKIEEEETW